MSVRGITDHVRERQITALWFGPNPAYDYSIICNQPHVKTVTLYPRDDNGNPIDSKKVVVETYEETSMAMAIHPLVMGTTVRIDLTVLGRQVEYDDTLRTEARVTFNGQSRVAHLHYSTPQSPQTLIDNAEVLQLIQ